MELLRLACFKTPTLWLAEKKRGTDTALLRVRWLEKDYFLSDSCGRENRF